MARDAWQEFETATGGGGGGGSWLLPRDLRPQRTPVGAPHAGRWRRPPAILRLASERIALWAERARQRRALAQLDARGLRDIGITRADQQRECEKPFWR